MDKVNKIMEELVKKVQKGDKKAFTNLLILLENDLYKIAKLRLEEEADIRDAVQETMITSFYSIKKLKNPSCFKSWIIKILINKSNDIYRNKNKRKIVSFDEIEDDVSVEESNIEIAEQTLDFNFFLKKLKYEERTIMILYYLEMFTDKEIGKILDMKEETVKSKRHRVLKNFKDNIKGGRSV